MAERMSRWPRVSTLVAPAGNADARVEGVALAGVRILVGLLWLYNVVWKQPPDFGKAAGNGLYQFTSDAVDHPVFPPYSYVVEHLVLRHFQPFGWMVLGVETTLAVLLLTGTLVRLAALVGVAQSVAIALSVVHTPGEWPWSYWMMIGIHVVLFATAAGRVAAVDAVRAEPVGAAARSRARRLVLGWGVVVCVAAVMALGKGFLNPSGARLGGPGFSVSLGSYNLLGSLVLLTVGVLMIAAAVADRPVLAALGAGLGLMAAASLYVQLGFSDPLLGGSNTSAAFFISAAVVALAARSRLGPRPPTLTLEEASHGAHRQA